MIHVPRYMEPVRQGLSPGHVRRQASIDTCTCLLAYIITCADKC